MFRKEISASVDCAAAENGAPVPMLLVKNVAVEENDIRNVKTAVQACRVSTIRPIDRQKMRPWLENLLHEGKTPGLNWAIEEEQIFSILWKHGASIGWSVEKDAQVFQKWAVHTGKSHKKVKAKWKANFRCAIKSLDDVIELRDHHVSKGEGAVRVFKFLEKKPSGIGKKLKTAPIPSPTNEQKVNINLGASGVSLGDGCDYQNTPDVPEACRNAESQDLLMSNQVQGHTFNADDAINQEHSENMLKRLHKLYLSNTLCNVSILMKNEAIKAHALVLCVNSTGFEEQMSALRNAFDNVQNMELFFGDYYDSSAMRSVVEYFYTSKISISNANVWLLLPLSNLLNVDDVRERCCEYIRFRLAAPLIVMLKSLLNNPILQNALNKFCKERHTESVKKTDKTIDHFITSHAQRILESINLARKFEKICDLVVLVKEERLIVHGVILAAQSECLCNKISRLASESLLPVPVLELNDFSAETISAVIQFFYTGNMTFDIKTVLLILSAKEIFQEVSDIFNPLGSLTNYPLNSWPHLKLLCRKIIKENFEQFINDDNYLSLNFLDFMPVAFELCAVSNLHIEKAIIAWLQHKSTRRKEFERIICKKLKIKRIIWS